jgi:signal transduction histidine kinase
VDEVVRSTRVLASARDVSVVAATISSASFTGDEDLIRRLLVNLLDNAIRYAPRGSTVQARLEQTPGRYAISVSDQGPGIPPDVQPHIFERFYRGDAARARSQSDGAGLGLALVRWIATVHRGDVTLTRSSDAGTTFTVQLPAPRLS